MTRLRTCALALVALLMPGSIPADTWSIAAPVPGSLAFARYIASIHRRDPFREPGVAVMIEASLPGLHKESRLLAIRDTDESERSEYTVLESQGDGVVTEEVIAPYLAEEKEVEGLPLSSVTVTPANYKFHFVAETGTAGASAVVFQIVPKKAREGLIRGEVWIDSATGVAVMQAGRFVKTTSAGILRIEMVRDTKLQDGSPSSRVTRVAVETRHVGRGYLTITEFPAAGTGRAASAGE